MMARRSDDLVQIATAPDETTAMMWREILEDEGIPVMLRSGGVGYSLGHNILNEQYLYVRVEDAEEAAGIIEAYSNAEEV